MAVNNRVKQTHENFKLGVKIFFMESKVSFVICVMYKHSLVRKLAT
jgi:hypothetical protein